MAVAAVVWAGAAAAPDGARPAATAAFGVLAAAIALRRLLLGTPGRPSHVAVGLLLVGAALVAGHRGAAAADAYRPLQPGPLAGPVTLLDDPRPLGFSGWRAEVRLPGGERVEAVAHGRAGDRLADLAVGATAEVEGHIRDVGARPWLRTRHIVGRASLASVEPGEGPGAGRSVVEGIRRAIGAGADRLDPRSRALYRGLVLGDDRFQPPGQVLRFRLSGLSHLLAVSGQNVAFVLAALAPFIGRTGGRVRLVGVVGVLILFALVTRLEPSVLRAVTTAGLSAWAVADGRARSGLGVLAGAVAVLVLVDPFLVDSVGFQLSVAASGGILVFTPALTRRLAGPGWLVGPLATSLGAQIGVAPLLSHYFGPVSLVAVPANLAAGWAAAAVMIWGLSVGLIVGVAPEPVATVIGLPVDGLLWWLESVARVGARLPAPRPGLAAVAAVTVLASLARTLPVRWPARAVLVAAAVLAIGAVPRPPTEPSTCGAGIDWFPAGVAGRSVLVVGADARLDDVESCRRAGIRRVDVVVVESGRRSVGPIVGALDEVLFVGEIRAPPFHAVIGARRTIEPLSIPTSDGVLSVVPTPDGDGLIVGFEP